VASQDIECDAANDRKVLRCVILASPGVVLVDDNVELPVEVILDTPMGLSDLQNPSGGELLGECDVAHSGGGVSPLPALQLRQYGALSRGSKVYHLI
jgi:hypothetical protein